MKFIRIGLLALIVACTARAGTSPVGTAFTYQGQLKQGGATFTGVIDVQCRLWDTPDVFGQTQIGSTICADGIAVAEGVFTISLDFGPGAFAADARFLEIGVRIDSTPDNCGSGNYTILSPRQRISGAPVAQFALGVNGATITNLNASNLASGIVPNAVIGGTYGNAVAFSNSGNSFSGSGSNLVNLNAAALGSGVVPSARISGTYSNALNFSNLANVFFGNGAGLSQLDAANISTGTLADNRLSVNIPRLNAIATTFTGSLSAAGFAGSGSALTQLNASNISQGTLQDARLSANIPRLASANAFTNTMTITGGNTSTPVLFVDGSAGSDLVLEAGNGLAGTIGQPVEPGGDVAIRAGNGGSSAISAGASGGDVRLQAGAQGSPVGFGTAPGRVLLLSDAGTCIGTSEFTPDALLHVQRASAGTVSANNGAVAVLESGGANYLALLTPDASEKGINFGSPANAVHGGIYYTNALGIVLRTGGNQSRAMLSPSGNLSVGVAGGSNDASLHVQNTSGASRPIKCDRIGSDGQLVAWARDDIVVGDVTVSGGVVSYNAFTGSHYAWMPLPNMSSTQLYHPQRGTLMKMTGDNRLASADGEVIYGVAPTTQANDPACLGAYLAPRPLHNLATGNHHVATEHQIMSVGNGELWVIDTGMDIQPGDLLISSNVEGCAMKDDPQQFAIGYVVARAAQTVRWSEIEPDETGTRRALVSVLFDCFTRSSGESESAKAATLSALQAESAELRSRLAALERAVADPLLQCRAAGDGVAAAAAHPRADLLNARVVRPNWLASALLQARGVYNRLQASRLSEAP